MSPFHLWCHALNRRLLRDLPAHRARRRFPSSSTESLEQRTLLSAATAPQPQPPQPPEVQSLDGSGNNLQNHDWGTAGSNFLRTAPAEYADGVAGPAGADRPSPREISNAVAAHDEADIKNNRQLSAMIYAWGQFIDHDIDLTNTADPAEAFNIAVPAGDPYFDPLSTGTKSIPLNRSQYDPDTGDSAADPRQQVNSISAYLDGSMVYGSDAATAASLRTFVGGRLKTSAGNLLPVDSESEMFLAGDIRANENIELISLQTLLMREHNRIADKLAAEHPDFSDEQLYQAARRWVIAEIQAVTYNEFLPALLGQNALPQYSGYDPAVNPGIANEFATAAYRVGHTMLGDDVEFLNNDGEEVREAVSLAEAFFNPDLVRETGIDSILKYLASDKAEEIDTQLVGSVRNFLFGPPGSGGLDLASLNIQRGRDHGLADYNAARVAYGLPAVTSFAEITSDPELQQQLADLYGSVDDIDLWIGGLAEDHVPGSSLGPTFRAIIADQFARLRDGDRFFYQNTFSGEELDLLRKTSLSDLIRRNTTTTNLQQNAFFFKAEISGQVFADVNADGRQNPGDQPLAGRTIELLDESGAVLRTTRTGPDGKYRFHNLDLGTYRVRELLPPGVQLTAQPASELRITRGMTISRQNFGETLPPPPAPSAIGAFRNGEWYLDANNNKSWNGSASGDARFTLGSPGDLPLTGDWNGDGQTDVGTFRAGNFYLDANGNQAWNGTAGGDARFVFGTPTDTPVTGDWNADGKTDIGVFRNGEFFLDANGNRTWDGATGGDLRIKFGTTGDLPVTGDWNGDRRTDVGIFRTGTFYIDTTGDFAWNAGDIKFRFGSAGDKPFSGDWNADGKTDVGVSRAGNFYLDANGNRNWDGTSGDLRLTFGSTTDLPVAGIWKGPPPKNNNQTPATTTILNSTASTTTPPSTSVPPLNTQLATAKKSPTHSSPAQQSLHDQLFSDDHAQGLFA